MADVPSQLPNNGNQNTKHDSNYFAKLFSVINDIEELSEGTFPITFKINDQYEQKDPSLTAKFKKR